MTSMIRDIKLAPSGHAKIDWVKRFMPVMAAADKEYSVTKPFAGIKMVITLHLEAKTAYMATIFKHAGADVAVTGSNPLSTQDDVAAAMVEEGIHVFAWHGCTDEEYAEFLNKALDIHPDIVIDDGGDLVDMLHTTRRELLPSLIGGSEETTTGVHRLHALARQGKLEFPMIAANDAYCKYLFDKTVVIAGYGWCGKGGAMRARGLGADVIITEVDPIKAIEAVFDGFRVMPMDEAAKVGDIFLTLTGNKDILRKHHFDVMKDGAMMANSGHFDVEINIPELTEASVSNAVVRENIREFVQKDGRRLYLLAEGRLVNLAAGDGHPAEIMDLSFGVQFFSALHLIRHGREMEKGVHLMPEEINVEIANIKLKSLGIAIDELSADQKSYLGLA